MDRNFKLSNYQTDILQFLDNSTSNLLVDAKAGSGKTSTLILIADKLKAQNQKCLFLAFNKHIVDELREKIPDEDSCLIKTVHSLGYSFIASYLFKMHGKDNYVLKTETGKVRTLVKEYYDKYFRDRIDFYNATGACSEEDVLAGITSNSTVTPKNDKELRKLHTDLISDFVGLCNYSRLHNANYKVEGSLYQLVDKFCWTLAPYTEDVLKDYQNLVIAVIDKIKELFENPEKDIDTGKPIYLIDYTDMIYFPVYYNMGVPYSVRRYADTVLCDECQDLSVLQQKFIRKLDTGFNRFIFVGDNFQSIYAFAGADTQAMKKLDETFILKHLPLNICYRCPEKVVKLAQTIVPTIEWNTAREDKGVVEFIDMEEVEDIIKPSEVIIGRKNKDLVKIYRHFVLDLKKPIKFRNKGLVDNLTSNIKKVIKDYMRLYSKGLNVYVKLMEHMKQYVSDMGYEKDTPEYTAEIEDFKRELISEASGMSERRAPEILTIDYLKKSMDDYRYSGKYGVEEDDDLTEFYSIIKDFIDEYSVSNLSPKVEDLDNYIQEFLSATLYDNAPEIGSVHSMKGGEADTIYIYDYPRFPYHLGKTPEDLQQEENLQYVAITRAKKRLYLVLCEEHEDRDRDLNIKSEGLVKSLFKEDEAYNDVN